MTIIKKSFLLFLFLSAIQYASAQKSDLKSEFTFSGEAFEDPDWGHCYKTSEQDQILLASVYSLMKQSVDSLLNNMGEYTINTLEDMSFVFDPEKQKVSLANGSKCVSCYYMISPRSGEHLKFTLSYRLSLNEESNTMKKKAVFDDSLFNVMKNDFGNKRAHNNSEQKEKVIQAESEEYEKEIQKMDFSNGNISLDKLNEIENKAKKIREKADNNNKTQQLDNNFYRNEMSFSYAEQIDLKIMTNEPIFLVDKQQFGSMKDNSDYYYEELKLPACSYAFIYFDKYNKAENLTESKNPVFTAYIGNIYPGKSKLPRSWVKPFCLKLSFSANRTQIKEIVSKIDFAKLNKIINP